MNGIWRVLLCAVLLSAQVWAVLEPVLNNEQKRHYDAMKAHLQARYIGIPNAEGVSYYSHLLGAQPQAEEDAWEHATTEGHIPVFVTMDDQEKNFFVTTRIPSSSRLGQKWNLRFRHDAERVNYHDAFALWHINKDGHKLLRLETWPEGAQFIGERPLEEYLRRVK